MRTTPIKLAPGDDLRLRLEQLAQTEQASGFVLGVVGNLSRAAFQCPGPPEPTVMEGDLEIITLNGTLSPTGVHLHLSLSDGACHVWGGHLEPGTLVLKGADVLVGWTESVSSAPAAAASQNQAARVEIAVLPNCPWSRRAVRLLRTLQIPHDLVSVEDDGTAKLFMERSGMRSFPQIFVDANAIGGYDALSQWHSEGRLNSLR